jgi:hypothetical protein
MKSTELPHKEPPAIPPFLQEFPIDPTTTLAYIQTEISSIYSAAKTSSNDNDQALHINHDRYIEIYNAVYNFCKESKSRPPANNVEILYRWLASEIRSFCKSTRGNALGLDSDDEMDPVSARKMLTTYMACHRTFTKLTSLVRGLVRFWDRHWMRREWSEKKIPVASVEDLHRAIWKEEILDIDAKNSLSKKGLEKLVDAVAVLRGSEDGMSNHDLTLVKDVSKSLSVLDLTLES